MPLTPLLLTPPFTQLNTPYPATAYLKGFLQTQGIAAAQADLGIAVILALFSPAGLRRLFAAIEELDDLEVSDNAYRIYALRDSYLDTIGPVMDFLQYRDPTLAHAIAGRGYLPEAGRFAAIEDLEWAFGTLGIQDQARHLATLYLEDLGDLIKETLDPHFGFTRYAEALGRATTHFDPLLEALAAPPTLITHLLWEQLAVQLQRSRPDLVCLSVPFPGNLYGAFRIAQYLRIHHPDLPIVLGGGYANTELRRLRDPRVFDYLDYVCLDDGEAPLLCLLDHLAGARPRAQLKRTFARNPAGQVIFYQGATERDVPQREVGTPDYGDLPLDRYLSVMEVANPMHRLWSDGRWNKLTLAHGCYWGKCAFCDISLDYIQRYEPLTAALLCDRIEALIAQTGQRGFHFVDEAAPPALMRDLAVEILRRRLTVTWWTNIRFETSFTPDLCRLLRASGCIAVSGGLEVASDRLLALMKKGVTVAQVARVAEAFTTAGIMVHAYLMYGFPTQTAQETIDSLEMVRQLFEAGVLQSGFWHRFAMTAHSPVGLDPAAYQVVPAGPDFGGFADNDRHHDDPTGADHDHFSEGLRVSLYNYMHGVGLDWPLPRWFEAPVPRPSIAPDYIARALAAGPGLRLRPHSRLLWLGPIPEAEPYDTPDGPVVGLTGYHRQREWQLSLPLAWGEWLAEVLPQTSPAAAPFTWAAWQAAWATHSGDDPAEWLASPAGETLRAAGLLIL